MSSDRQEIVGKPIHLRSDFLVLLSNSPASSPANWTVGACVNVLMNLSRILFSDDLRLWLTRVAESATPAFSKRTIRGWLALFTRRFGTAPTSSPSCASASSPTSASALSAPWPCTAGSSVMCPMCPVSKWWTKDFFVIRPANSAKRATNTTLIPSCLKMLCTWASGVSGTILSTVSSTSFERSNDPFLVFRPKITGMSSPKAPNFMSLSRCSSTSLR
mmetsp:Transcript_64064/g.179241  ORF Transcript_64064/g.179241 Transcript_64064/m.179241 type:complete len:218 (-) Transcript_64064:2241-2894(-)